METDCLFIWTNIAYSDKLQSKVWARGFPNLANLPYFLKQVPGLESSPGALIIAAFPVLTDTFP